MDISEKRIKEYVEAYKQEFGDDISPDDAREQLFRLTFLYEELLKPLPEEKANVSL